MIRLYPLIFILVSCSAVPTLPRNRTIRKIPVDSRDQAVKVVDNHVRFLKMLFQQSRDPYYGKLKWPEECLKANQVGERIEVGEVLVSNSLLLLDSRGVPGNCDGSKHTVIMLYCPGAKDVQDIRFPSPVLPRFRSEDYCP